MKTIAIPSKVLIKNSYSTTQEQQEYFSTLPANNYNVCPFTIISGDINATNAGYRNDYARINDYASFTKIFTGRESFIVNWDNSFTLEQNNPNLPNTWNIDPNSENNTGNSYYGNKIFQIGSVYNGLLENDSATINFTPSPENSNFTQEQVTKTVTIVIPNNDNKDNHLFFRDIPSHLFKLYNIPILYTEPNNNEPSYYQGVNPKVNPFNNYDKQFYYISTIEKVWSKQEKFIMYVKITFISLNDTLAHTGLAINQYIQTGGPGEPFAFPILGLNGEIELDPLRLKPLPITHVQVTFYGTQAISNIMLYGRPVENQDISNPLIYKIYAPRLVLPYSFQAPIYDQISLKAVPSNNYYFGFGNLTVDTYFSNWKEALTSQQLYDETVRKIYEGHLRSNKANIRDSNPISESSPLQKPYWDSTLFDDYNSKLANYSDSETTYYVNGSWLFQYQNLALNPQVDIKVNTNNVFNYKSVSGNWSLARWNLYNYATHHTIYQYPLNVRQTTPLTLGTLPIIGGFLNLLTAGVPVGWKYAITNLPRADYIPFLMNTTIFDTITDTLYNLNENSLSVIPLNTFDTTPDSAINALLGTNTQTTAFTFNLTDLITTGKYTTESVETPPTNTINTSDLGQYIQVEGDTTKSVHLLDKTTILINSNKLGYVIDAIHVQGLGKNEYSIAFFSKTANKESPIDWNYCVWFGKYQSLARATNNTRLWTELKQLSNPTFAFKQNFNYPFALQLPIPNNPDTLEVDYTNEVNTNIKTNTDFDLPLQNNIFLWLTQQGEIRQTNTIFQTFNQNILPNLGNVDMYLSFNYTAAAPLGQTHQNWKVFDNNQALWNYANNQDTFSIPQITNYRAVSIEVQYSQNITYNVVVPSGTTTNCIFPQTQNFTSDIIVIDLTKNGASEYSLNFGELARISNLNNNFIEFCYGNLNNENFMGAVSTRFPTSQNLTYNTTSFELTFNNFVCLGKINKAVFNNTFWKPLDNYTLVGTIPSESFIPDIFATVADFGSLPVPNTPQQPAFYQFSLNQTITFTKFLVHYQKI